MAHVHLQVYLPADPDAPLRLLESKGFHILDLDEPEQCVVRRTIPNLVNKYTSGRRTWTNLFCIRGNALLYGAGILWRFRFALNYAGYRRARWILPIVKLTMDFGTEVGRWKALARQAG